MNIFICSLLEARIKMLLITDRVGIDHCYKKVRKQEISYHH